MRAFMAGAAAAGANVMDVGLCTTPMLYHAIASDAVSAETLPHGGAMITASHNPPEYNGMKLSRAQAKPIGGDSGLFDIEPMAAAAPKPEHLGPLPVELEGSKSEGLPAAPRGVHPGLWASYCLHKRAQIAKWPAKPVVACDPANMMGCLYLPLMEWLGMRVESVFGELDGRCPNHEANPLKPKNMEWTRELVLKSNATIGVSFDGDADRAVFVDETGELIPSDIVLAVLARHMLSRETNAGACYDLRSSWAVAQAIREAGGRAYRTRVGHAFVKKDMRDNDCLLGGELSGHFYFRSASYADSAIIALIELLNVIGETGKPLSQLAREVRRFSQSGEINFHVEDKDGAMQRLAEIWSAGEIDWVDGITVQFSDWWFNVRKSNTEPLLRLNVEARDPETVAARVAEISGQIGGELEVD